MVTKKDWEKEGENVRQFVADQAAFWTWVFDVLLGWAGFIKTTLSKLMYRQRGRFSQTFVNGGMAILAFLVMVFSGKIESIIVSANNEDSQNNLMVLSANQDAVTTMLSDSNKGEITQYRVQDGDTVGSIAQKFGVSIDTIMWENNLKSVDSIKAGELLNILPVTGVRHLVKRGETIYSIAKYYNVDPQNIIDYPFNSFTNDETYSLAAGQELIVPDGVKPNEVIIDTQHYATKTVAPVPGVVGEGKFMWPTTGTITQKFSWYHSGVDIANHDGPDIMAAASGTVVTAGWNPGGYGNYVIIDHGNGYKTLYGHMVTGSIVVKAGDVVKQGQKIGRMGSTGRSTGTHLHFEIRPAAGGFIDPLTLLH